MTLFLESGAAAGGSNLSFIIMMVALIAVFYFFMIRPENKRKKEAEAMRNALKVGDNITTIGGIIGDVVSVKDNSIVIETSADPRPALSSRSSLSPATTPPRRKPPSRRLRWLPPARKRRQRNNRVP